MASKNSWRWCKITLRDRANLYINISDLNASPLGKEIHRQR
jgi:hypothetical protein